MNKIYKILLLLVLSGCTTTTKELPPEVKIHSVSTPVDASLRGLHALDENTVWISGSKGTYLRTLDGGISWEYGSFLDSVDFRDIYAFDKDRVIMISAGMPAVIYKSEDGGKNWSLKYKNEDSRVFFDAIDFWDELHGIAFGDSFDGRFFMIITSDGGNTWDQLLSAPEAVDGEGGFAASGTNMVVSGTSEIWIGTTTGRVIYSDNRGVSWEYSSSPLEKLKEDVAGIFSIAISESNGNGLLVGGNFQEPENPANNAAFLKDGLWVSPVTSPNGYRSCVEFIPETSLALTTGTSGTDISYDLGQSWLYLDSLGFHSISFGNTLNSGWMSGERGRVAKISINLLHP